MNQTEAGPAVCSPDTVNAVLLAGSVNRIPLFAGYRAGCKALVPMLGRPLISYVLDALRSVRAVGRILVVGPESVHEFAQRWPNVEAVPEGASLVENALAGIRAARSERVLFCNPDQPLLRAEMIEDFLERAAPHDEDVVSSWIRADSLGRFAGVGAHKLARFGDGRFGHGNLFLAQRTLPDAAEARARFDALYRGRKNIVRFAWALGPELFGRFLMALATRRMPTLSETLALASRRFGIRIGSAISPYPEIALDIDEPEDYAAAEAELRGQAVGGWSQSKVTVPPTEGLVFRAAERLQPVDFNRIALDGVEVESSATNSESAERIGCRSAREGGKAARVI